MAKKGAPSWMVSFGDMMTLILTFFILLVSLSKDRQEGLVARGIGSFLVALRSFGLPGVLDASERLTVYDNVRRRFNLPEEPDPERRARPEDAATGELLPVDVAKALAPHDEINQPAVARFDVGSAELDGEARGYLDLLAPVLRPGPGELLLLEGHALDAGSRPGGDRRLAFERARAVARYLIDEHGIPAQRVEPRAWISEIAPAGPGTRVVDARLVLPNRDER